jgi:hypothetical protein
MSQRTLTGIVVFAGFKKGMGEVPTVSYRNGNPEVNFIIRLDDGKETPFQMSVKILPEEIDAFSNIVCGKRAEYQDSFEKGLVNKRLLVMPEGAEPIEYSVEPYRMY